MERLAITINIIWTKQGEERQQQWQQKRSDITREAVETFLSYPEQIVPENDGFVAQSKLGTGLLRVVYIELGNSKRIITLYWTSQVKRYWQENNHES